MKHDKTSERIKNKDIEKSEFRYTIKQNLDAEIENLKRRT